MANFIFCGKLHFLCSEYILQIIDKCLLAEYAPRRKYSSAMQLVFAKRTTKRFHHRCLIGCRYVSKSIIQFYDACKIPILKNNSTLPLPLSLPLLANTVNGNITITIHWLELRNTIGFRRQY